MSQGIFRATSNVPAPVGGLSVSLVFSGSAIQGTDYVTLPEAVTIPEGQTFIDIPVTILDDNIAELSESIIATITPAVQYTVGVPASTTITIQPSDIITLDTTIIATDFTVSADKLEISSVLSSWRTARDIIGYSTGKHYFEVTRVAGSFGMAGLANNFQQNNHLEIIGNDLSYFFLNGTVRQGNVVIDTLPLPVSSNTVGVLFDATLDRVNFVIDNVILGNYLVIDTFTYFASMSVLGDTCRINFGQSAFSNTLPIGFSSWDNSQSA